jgi:hypothetical protein
MPWGLPAQRSWHVEATDFAGVTVREAAGESGPPVLEDYLARKA